MRALVLAFALMAASGCAHADRQDETAAHEVARVMLASMAPSDNAESGYAWDALKGRVSPPVNWHDDLAPAGDEPGSGVLLNGWLRKRQQGYSSNPVGLERPWRLLPDFVEAGFSVSPYYAGLGYLFRGCAK